MDYGTPEWSTYKAKYLRGKTFVFWVGMAIHGKTFVVGFLYTYIADRQKSCFVEKDSQLSE